MLDILKKLSKTTQSKVSRESLLSPGTLEWGIIVVCKLIEFQKNSAFHANSGILYRKAEVSLPLETRIF